MVVNLSFKLLELADCLLLHQWLHLEHIRSFWDDGDRSLQQVIDHYIVSDNTKRYLFFLDSEPVGYIQSYIINTNHPYSQIISVSDKIMGVDFFIGNLNFLGKGYASIVLKEFIKIYCNDSNIIVDPAINNYKSIHIYNKIGFDKLIEFNQDSVDYQLMIKYKNK